MAWAKLPYTIVVPTVYGRMLLNRNDINQTGALVKTGMAPDHAEIVYLTQILDLIPEEKKVVIDVGANMGTYTLAMAHHLGAAGTVYALEPQRLVFQLLCGSVALNSLPNVHCLHAAAGAEAGRIPIPQYDYFQPLNFGSIEFGEHQREPLHQERGRDAARHELVDRITIDSLELPALHILKIDAEGMEFEVIAGARDTIARCSPVIHVEHLKVDKVELARLLKQMDYAVFDLQQDYLCIPAKYESAIRISGVTQA